MLSGSDVNDTKSDSHDHGRLYWLGIGPKFAVGSLLYTAVVVALHHMYPAAMIYTELPVLAAWIGGSVLALSGLVVYAISAIQLRAAFRKGQLRTSGIYAHVRHPIYASFMLLIAPGLVIIARSIPGVTIPFVMYGLFRAFIDEEERRLLREFGDEFTEYKARVESLIPRLPTLEMDEDK